jgi:hypothetical protein
MSLIPLHGQDGIVAYAIVDDDDFEWLSRWRWGLKKGYAARTVHRRKQKPPQLTFLMHRRILGLEHGDRRQGEHKNRDRLDCRRSNLRVAMRGYADNNQNKPPYRNNASGYRGVSALKDGSGMYRARAQLDGKQYSLGRFDTPEQADEAVKAWRAQHMPFSEDAAAEAER